ncbi:MAG: ribokinase [Synergistaceae bacterium]|jgi:ribokinase|nr:ribokinase [Synergistaceae bacterium]
MKIAVIGSNMIDLVTKVNRMPRMGETIEAPSFDMGFGGKGANQAVAIAKLGGDVLMLTKVGGDIFGPSVRENFESLGVDARYVETVPGASSGVAPIFVDPDSNNSILIVKGANNFLSAKDIDRAADDIKKCGLIILQLEVHLDTVYYAIEWGVKNGVPVILNPAPAVELDYNYVRKVTFFIPNETELAAITGTPVSEMDDISAAARSLVREGVRNVIVTLGSKGSLYITEGREELVPPHIVKPVDSTGAGDAFIGSFAHYYLKTGDVIEAMKTANRYAALSTMKPGTQKSFPTLEEFEKAKE